MTALSFTRRRMLSLAAALPLAAGLARPRPAFAAGAARPRVLVLLELSGGNDGLNTVVPYADPAYGRLRKRLAVPRGEVPQLDERLGLHPRLAPLMTAWRDGDLAIVQGVGYPRPNRSHFRSIEIWDSASDSEAVISDGWVGRVLREAGSAGETLRRGLAADGLILGGNAGPLSGGGLRSLMIRDPERFLDQALRSPAGPAASDNPALAHILRVRGQIDAAARAIEASLEAAPALAADFPRSPTGRQFAAAARLIAAEVPVAVLKLTQGGYDTHAGQERRHPRLLEELAAALTAFRTAMRQSGDWERVLVMSYAEFGRRAEENASGGTDHGTAAPHFLLGGRVKGGFYGPPPDLGDLDSGDLRFGLDFRRLYATAAQAWWGLPPTPDALAGAKPLPCLA